MNPAKILTQPLAAASVALVLAIAWAYSYTSANSAARAAAEKVRPWTALAREQMPDVGACEDKARAGARDKFPGAAQTSDREITARKAAFSCAAAYLLAQPLTSPSVASQVLGYAAGAATRQAALGDPAPLDPAFEPLYRKAADDARKATLDADRADEALRAACQGFLAASACSLAQLTPDRPGRLLGEAMREFEWDVHAQQWIATHPAEEVAHQMREPKGAGADPQARSSPAYAFAREATRAAAARAR